MLTSGLSVALALAFSAAPPPPPPVVAGFNLRDPAGRRHRLSDWPGARAVVVVFLSVDCPLAKLYAPRLAEMHARYHPQGVQFVALASNRRDATVDLVRFVRQHRLPFPFLEDPGAVISSRFEAQRTPEVFVLDRQRRIQYRGRIDDQYSVGIHKPFASRHELIDALEAVLADRRPQVTRTEAPGCPIDTPERAEKNTEVTYCRDIAPILRRHCQVCHRPGQVGPFPLESYADASGWSAAIREVVEQKRMPPWGADPKHGRFANDPSLSKEDRDRLFRWIDGGCPEGDPRDLPPPTHFPTGWTIPGPDLVIEMPREFTVPAQGVVEYQYFVVDPGFQEDRWVKAAEIQPGNPAVVHHVNIFLQPPGADSPEDLSSQGTLGSYCLTMTAQGTQPLLLSDGLAKRIPAGWRIVFVMHYQAVGSVQTDRTRLGLTFADPKTVKKEVATRLMFDPDLRIPPRVANHEVEQTWAINRDVLLLSFFPHMHLRGKSFRYELIHPDGREETLLSVERFDFAWQHRYILAEPMRVRAGSKLRCVAVYDNSADNPANPAPDSEVRAGAQSWEEMFNGYFDVTLADEDLTRPGLPRIPPGMALVTCLVGGVFLSRKRLARVFRSEDS